MKFLKGLVWLILLIALFYALSGESVGLKAIFILALVAWIIFLVIKRYRDKLKLPGGIRGGLFYRGYGCWKNISDLTPR